MAACIDTDAAVFVEPTITKPSAEVAALLLGVSLSGSFELSLHLGPRASGESRVTLGSFSLQSADETVTVIEPLPITSPAEVNFMIQPDSTTALTLSFDTGTSLLASDVLAKLCAPGGVRVKGVVDDALKGGPTPVVSEPFTPAGC